MEVKLGTQHRGGRARSGQMLIEALVALSVLTMGFVGIFSLLNQSLSLHRVVANNYVATYLASEGVELVKSAVAQNVITGFPLVWNSNLSDGVYEVDYLGTFTLAGGTLQKLQYDPSKGSYGYTASTPTTFERTVTITSISSQELRVVCMVRWITRGSTYSSISVEDHLYNWRG